MVNRDFLIDLDHGIQSLFRFILPGLVDLLRLDDSSRLCLLILDLCLVTSIAVQIWQRSWYQLVKVFGWSSWSLGTNRLFFSEDWSGKSRIWYSLLQNSCRRIHWLGWRYLSPLAWGFFITLESIWCDGGLLCWVIKAGVLQYPVNVGCFWHVHCLLFLSGCILNKFRIYYFLI